MRSWMRACNDSNDDENVRVINAIQLSALADVNSRAADRIEYVLVFVFFFEPPTGRLRGNQYWGARAAAPAI